jgi:hypothetical protein
MRAVLSTLALACAVTGAAAETVPGKVGDRAYAIVLPEGFCGLDEKIEGHRKLLDFARKSSQGYNELVAIAAPCTETEALAAGKTQALIASYVVLSPIQTAGQNLGGQQSLALQRFCDDMRQGAGGGVGQSSIDLAQERADGYFAKMGPGDLQPLGFYLGEVDVCYSGFASKRANGDGTAASFMILNAMTAMKGSLLQFVQTAPVKDKADIKGGLKALQDNVAATLAGNPG